MRRALLGCIGLLVLLSAPTVSAGGNGRTRWFTGLWQGVDPVDGSTVVVSLSDLDRDGVLEIAGHESFFFACNGDGLQTGTATVTKGGTLDARLSLKCRPGPLQFLNTPATFEPYEQDDILVLKVPAEDPATVPIVLHRTSAR